MAWGKTDREGCKWRRPTLIPVYRLPAECRFLSSATPSLCGKKNNQQQCCRLRKEREKRLIKWVFEGSYLEMETF
uniref:Uncharacterized protein n=1 Tax=Oryza glumipatula TaxID=40148 RepID=A0A0D9Z4P1_9ORYZ